MLRVHPCSTEIGFTAKSYNRLNLGLENDIVSVSALI